MGESLRWFGAWKKPEWRVGWAGRRYAYASGRGGRYQIVRFDDCFAVAYCPPYKCPDEPWEDIGIVTTQEEAIALAQAHNNQTDDDAVRCPHCLKALHTRWEAGMTAVERAQRLHERQLQRRASERD